MVPNGWNFKELAEVCSKPISYGIVQTGPEVNEGIPCVRVVDLTKQKLKTSDMILTSQEIHQSYKKTILQKNELMMALRGEIGLIRIVTDNLVGINITRGIARLAPKLNDIDPNYLLWAMRSSHVKNDLMRKAGGSALQEIALTALRKVKVPVPPLPEQRKIAKILSTWDKAISTTERLIDNSKQQKKALMQQLLTGKKRLLDKNGVRFSVEWNKTSLQTVCRISTGKKDVNEGNPNGIYPFFTCANEHTYSDSYSYDFEALLIAGNGILGKTHYYNGKFEAYQRTYILSGFSNKIDVRYLHQFILYWLLRDIEREKQHGAMPYIKLGLLQNFKVMLPAVKEQQKIAAVLSSADEEIDRLQQKIEALKQEKKALMQQLLTGKRRVKVDDKEVA